MIKIILSVLIMFSTYVIADSSDSDVTNKDVAKVMLINLVCQKQKLDNISNGMNDLVADQIEVNCISNATSSSTK